MRKFLYIALLSCIASACSDSDKPFVWEWGTSGPTTPTSERPRIVWIDAGGNFEYFANSQANIKADLKRVSDAGFTEIVVDVRPTNGDLLFNSSVGEPLTRLDVWTDNGYEWIYRTATWDYLQTFIDEGHALGLKVNASFNTFVGGYACPYGLGSDGMLYRDESKKSWASVINTTSGLSSVIDLTGDGHYGARFLNPANDDVCQFLLTMLGDLAKYDLDGIYLDRCRYDDYDLMSDFSPESRRKFEQFIGATVPNFPGDILAPGSTDAPYSCSSLLKRWLTFRAKNIHDFVEAAAERVHSVNPDIRFGCYVGGWYSTYYMCGVNWASPRYNPRAISTYASRVDNDYMQYGYADHLDMISIGAYTSASSIYGQDEWTMQGFAIQAGRLLMGDTPYYCGPDIGNCDGWVDGHQQALIPDAVAACCDNSDGVFIFDLCYIRSFNYWNAFKSTFKK